MPLSKYMGSYNTLEKIEARRWLSEALRKETPPRLRQSQPEPEAKDLWLTLTKAPSMGLKIS